MAQQPKKVQSVNSADAKDADKAGTQNDKAVDNKVTIAETSVGGTGAVAVNAPHIVQYPRPPKRDDGRWLALASVIGNVIGKLSSQKVIKGAKKAEDEWKDVMARMKDLADREAARVDPLRDKAQQAMDDLDKRNTRNWGLSDVEHDYADRLKPCIDSAADDLCRISNCGYEADYDGIYTRVAADAALATQKEFDKICRINSRYNTGWGCDIRAKLSINETALVVGEVNKQREIERQNKWKLDYEMKRQTFETLEGARLRRETMQHTYDTAANSIRGNQYTNYRADADNSLKMGADLLASHGQNAAWLADSLRKTAKESMANWGTLAAMITSFILTWNSKFTSARNAECGETKENPVDKMAGNDIIEKLFS